MVTQSPSRVNVSLSPNFLPCHPEGLPVEQYVERDPVVAARNTAQKERLSR